MRTEGVDMVVNVRYRTVAIGVHLPFEHAVFV
jgi:hypothetical protein